MLDVGRTFGPNNRSWAETFFPYLPLVIVFFAVCGAFVGGNWFACYRVSVVGK